VGNKCPNTKRTEEIEIRKERFKRAFVDIRHMYGIIRKKLYIHRDGDDTLNSMSDIVLDIEVCCVEQRQGGSVVLLGENRWERQHKVLSGRHIAREEYISARNHKLRGVKKG
jgi:hypothetical protein